MYHAVLAACVLPVMAVNADTWPVASKNTPALHWGVSMQLHLAWMGLHRRTGSMQLPASHHWVSWLRGKPPCSVATREAHWP